MKKILGAIMIGAAVAGACSTTKPEAQTTPTASYLPKAIVYKAPERYADLVPVSLNAAGTALASFPAPSDLDKDSEPLSLGDGWYLDRRGVGPRTVFTSYTYSEYRDMASAPAPSVLMEKIVDRAPFEAMYRLPIGRNQAVSDPGLCKKYIKNGFKDCEALIEPAE